MKNENLRALLDLWTERPWLFAIYLICVLGVLVGLACASAGVFAKSSSLLLTGLVSTGMSVGGLHLVSKEL